jgi:hypothetical protein
LGPRGRERIAEVGEIAEGMQIEEPNVIIGPAQPQISFFEHDRQVFRHAFSTLHSHHRDVRCWVVEWAKLQTSERKLDFPPQWDHPSISPREDDLNPLNDWSTRFAFLFRVPWDPELGSAMGKLRRCMDESSIERFKFAAVQLDFTMVIPFPDRHSNLTWYSSAWDKALYILGSAITTANESINAARGAVDYASQVLTSFNTFPLESGNTLDDMRFTFFTNIINTYDIKSAWMSVESLWERFSGQVSKLAFGTKGWPPNHLGEVVDSLFPVLA